MAGICPFRSPNRGLGRIPQAQDIDGEIRNLVDSTSPYACNQRLTQRRRITSRRTSRAARVAKLRINGNGAEMAVEVLIERMRPAQIVEARQRGGFWLSAVRGDRVARGAQPCRRRRSEGPGGAVLTSQSLAAAPCSAAGLRRAADSFFMNKCRRSATCPSWWPKSSTPDTHGASRLRRARRHGRPRAVAQLSAAAAHEVWSRCVVRLQVNLHRLRAQSADLLGQAGGDRVCAGVVDGGCGGERGLRLEFHAAGLLATTAASGRRA